MKRMFFLCVLLLFCVPAHAQFISWLSPVPTPCIVLPMNDDAVEHIASDLDGGYCIQNLTVGPGGPTDEIDAIVYTTFILSIQDLDGNPYSYGAYVQSAISAPTGCGQTSLLTVEGDWSQQGTNILGAATDAWISSKDTCSAIFGCFYEQIRYWYGARGAITGGDPPITYGLPYC